MITITLAQLKSDIASKMKGTSISQIKDFYATAQTAADRMLARIDTQESRRTATLATPFWDNVNDYVLPTDYKGMIDIRPQANRQSQPGKSDYLQTTAKQFNERLDSNSFSIRWNNMVRTLRAQRLPSGNILTFDTFDSAIENGLWTGEGDVATTWDENINWDQGFNWDNGLYTEPLNFISGNGSMGFNLSGVTGLGDIVNSTALPLDLTQFNFEDTSMIYFYIPIGFASRFTNFKLRRGSNASNYVEVTVTTKADGTAFSDGWNFLLFGWINATLVGAPNDTLNTYRRFGITYTVGPLIKGCLIDAWTDSLGDLNEIEYYSEYGFRTSTGSWISVPTVDTDLLNVGPASYEILKTEMMVDITQQIRTGAVRATELADWRLMLNGQPQSRYVKDPPYHGLYADYLQKFPSNQIITVTKVYDFDV